MLEILKIAMQCNWQQYGSKRNFAKPCMNEKASRKRKKKYFKSCFNCVMVDLEIFKGICTNNMTKVLMFKSN